MNNYVIPRVFFIDRVNFTNLQDDGFDLNDLFDIFADDYRNEKVSYLTRMLLEYFNEQLIYLINNGDKVEDLTKKLPESLAPSSSEKKYIEDYFDTYLRDTEVHEGKKYYELVGPMEDNILVVVEKGFLSFVTKSKDNLLRFILDLLCYHNRFNLSTMLLFRSYITLKLNDGKFNLLNFRYN